MAVQVTVTIPPLAGMVQPFLTDEDKLVVLLEPGMSPHGFQFRPSHLMALQHADLVVTVGNSVDSWVDKPLKQRLHESQSEEHSVAVITMQKQPGLVVYAKSTLPQRRGLGMKSVENDHEHHHSNADHEHENLDPHIWLSIANARLMLPVIAAQLEALQPSREAEIQAISERLVAEYQQLDQQISAWLEAVKDVPYLVLHDGYQYFERAYGLEHLGVVQVSEELKTSIKQVFALRALIQDKGVRCVFKEPQFSDQQLGYIIKGLSVTIGELDPLGQGQTPEQAKLDYRHLMRQLAISILGCLQTTAE